MNTGLSQIIALIAIGIATRTFNTNTIGQIGIVESSILLTTSIISFGLQLSTNRNIVIHKDWMAFFKQGQKARITLSLILFPLGLTYWINGNITYLFFFASPLIALNGDYALYGRGYPEYASKISFFRVLIPSVVLIICATMNSAHVVMFYIAGAVLGILIAGLLSSVKLNANYLFIPEIKAITHYFPSLKIGIASVSMTLMGSGIILLSNHFYDLNTVGEAYLGIKLFILYKGVRRIVIQSFFSELTNEPKALLVDRLNIVIGISVATVFVFFPMFVIHLFFGDTTDSLEKVMRLVGVAILFSSLTSVAGVSMLLKKMDNAYSISFLSSMIVSLLLLICISKIQPDPSGILFSVISGEISLLLFFSYFLGYKTFFSKRIKIFLLNSIILIPPPISIYIFDNRYAELGVSLVLSLLLLTLFNINHVNRDNG